MKTLLLLLTMAVMLQGCGLSLAKKIPYAEFNEFEYVRVGYFSTACIVAKKARKRNDILMIDEVKINASYGPVVTFFIRIKDYIRATPKGNQ